MLLIGYLFNVCDKCHLLLAMLGLSSLCNNSILGLQRCLINYYYFDSWLCAERSQSVCVSAAVLVQWSMLTQFTYIHIPAACHDDTVLISMWHGRCMHSVECHPVWMNLINCSVIFFITLPLIEEWSIVMTMSVSVCVCVCVCVFVCLQTYL